MEGAPPDGEGAFAYDPRSGAWLGVDPREAVREGVNLVYVRCPSCTYCRLLDIKLADLLREFAGKVNFVVVNCAWPAPCPPGWEAILAPGLAVSALPAVAVVLRARQGLRLCARFEGVPSLAELRAAVRLALRGCR